MQAYIIRRLLMVIPTFLVVTAIVFLVLRFVPGTALEMMLAQMPETDITGVTVESLKVRLGLDVPILTQYGRWMGFLPSPVGAFSEGGFSGLLQGNLGTSLWTTRPVGPELFDRLPVSIELGFLGMVIALSIALPIGIYSAMRQDTAGDYGGRSFAILCISLPSFWLGTMVMVYPSIWWDWMPPLNYAPFFENPITSLSQFMLPAIILGMVLSGTTMRMTRTMMLEVLRQDYIRTAWSKGLSERTVILRHALKNALIPVVTIVGMQIPILIGGAVVLEQIFVLPGIGRFMLQAINQRDYPIISAINVVLSAGVLIINLVVDLTYAYLDPRIQYR